MYDWQDKDGQSKLLKILNKLVDNGFNATKGCTHVKLYDSEGQYVCDAYSSTWHDLGHITVKRWTADIGTTFSPDKAYEMMVDYYNEWCKGENHG